MPHKDDSAALIAPPTLQTLKSRLRLVRTKSEKGQVLSVASFDGDFIWFPFFSIPDRDWQ